MPKDQLHLHRCALAIAAALVVFPAAAADGDTPALRYRVIAQHPHDATHFTQGLAVHAGRLLESTGGYGASALWVKHPMQGRVIAQHPLDASLFGEGLAVGLGEIVQLTWRSGLALRYDAASLQPRPPYRYTGEGWGLAFDGRRYYMSDGSDRIALRDARSFEVVGALAVRDGARPVRQLNELEHARGLLWANVWHSDRIAAIDPASGRVRGWLDLRALRGRFAKPPAWNPSEHVLNGIAYDRDTGHFLVTGKCWPALFEIAVEAP